MQEFMNFKQFSTKVRKLLKDCNIQNTQDKEYTQDKEFVTNETLQ